MDLRKTLEILADGEFHSGEKIGQAMGVSRAAVWKHLSGLERIGLEVESRHRKGYRVPGGLDLLVESSIRAGLDLGAAVCEIDVLLEVNSTNQCAIERSEESSLPYVCLAESQHAGRGRLGRTWVSPFANSVYLSLAWEFDEGAAALEGLSLAVGVAIVRALGQNGIRDVKLKWPNDIVSEGSKLGGVLIELKGDLSGPCTAVIGIGLNGALAASSGEQIDRSWTDLKTLNRGKLPNRNQLVANLLNGLVGLLSTYQSQGFAAWRDEWQALDSLQEQTVTAHVGTATVEGKALGVDERGALLLDTAEGRRSFSGGEVSLKLQP